MAAREALGDVLSHVSGKIYRRCYKHRPILVTVAEIVICTPPRRNPLGGFFMGS